MDREIDVDGVARSYRIHVPASWDRKKPIPVLLVFHGAGSDAESMVRATGFDEAAETANALVVYPRAPLRTKRYDVDPPAGRTSADVRFVELPAQVDDSAISLVWKIDQAGSVILDQNAEVLDLLDGFAEPNQMLEIARS